MTDYMTDNEVRYLNSLSDDAIALFYEVYELNVRSEGIYESIQLAWDTLKEENFI